MSVVEIYRAKDGNTQVEVRFEGETLWLTLNQLALLFERDKSVISRHLRNIYQEGELNKKSTVAKNATVQTEAARAVKRSIEYYNLDAILSVGYRVNSKRGTQFRQWATQRLNDYLVKGVAINEKRLQQLQQTIRLISKGGKMEGLELDEAKGLLDIINHYTQSFALLNQYDSNSLTTEKLDSNVTYHITYTEAKTAIGELKKQLQKKKEATAFFGNEKDDGFKSSLQSILQTFTGQYVYASIEEQAAHLLYFIIKNQ